MFLLLEKGKIMWKYWCSHTTLSADGIHAHNKKCDTVIVTPHNWDVACL